MKSYDWKSISNNTETSNGFCLQVFNRFQVLTNYDDDFQISENNLEDVYDSLISSTAEVAKKTLPLMLM